MAIHDYVAANQSGASFRADLNNLFLAIASQNSNATEPTTKYAYQWWMDTTTGLLKIRNAANTAWITVGDPSLANFGLALKAAINTFSAKQTFSANIVMSAAGIEGAEASITAHATTMNPWSGADTRKMTGGAVTVTDFANAPAAGLWRKLILNAAHTFNDTATTEVFGNANWTGAAGDIVWLYSKSTTITTIIPMKKDGTPIGGAGTPPTRQVFTSSGTWNRPTGCKTILVRVQGGGGNGSSTSGQYGGGGGGGGYAEKLIDVTAISSVTVTVGAAASLSKFDTHCTGNAGGNASGLNAGGGGLGTGGDVNAGGGGGEPSKTTNGKYNKGGDSHLGGGGTHGLAGLVYGGGGSGGFGGAAPAGGAGIVIVEEFY